MENLNRIKAVLAETGCTGKWLAEQLGKDQLQFRNGVLMAHPTNPVEQTCGTNLKTIDKRYMKSLKAVPLAS